MEKARRRHQRVILEVRSWVKVSVLARNGYSLPRVQQEIALCDVRCANCHRLRTHHQRGWWGSLVADQS